MVGFGTDQAGSLAKDTAPFTTLANRYAPWLGLLVGLAGISSIFAVAMNSANGIVRIVFAMGREGLLPRRLGRVHPVHRTPTAAIWLQAVVAVVFTYGIAATVLGRRDPETLKRAGAVLASGDGRNA